MVINLNSFKIIYVKKIYLMNKQFKVRRFHINLFEIPFKLVIWYVFIIRLTENEKLKKNIYNLKVNKDVRCLIKVIG